GGSGRVRERGREVSWSAVIGTTPLRLTSPSVGLMPTSMFWPEGLRIDPDVSVPTPTVARFADTAIPGPELEPPVGSTGRPSFDTGGGPGSTIVLGSIRGSNGLKPKPTFARLPPFSDNWNRSCEL